MSHVCCVFVCMRQSCWTAGMILTLTQPTVSPCSEALMGEVGVSLQDLCTCGSSQRCVSNLGFFCSYMGIMGQREERLKAKGKRK